MTAIHRLLLVILIVLPGCATERVFGPANGLIGDYVSTEFEAPGPNDAPVDIQAAGGSLQMTLMIDNSFSAAVIIPQGISTVIGSGTTNTYSGVFSLSGDTLRIDTSRFIVGGMKWDKGSSSLTSISPPRWGTHFILHKQ